MYNQRSVGSTHSSHGNLSQASITSGDVLSGDEVDIALQQPAKISGSTDGQGSYAIKRQRDKTKKQKTASY